MVSIDDECEFHGLFKERIPGPLRWPSLATNLASCPTESESSGASIHYRRSAYILVLRTRTIGGSSTIDSLPATVDHASQYGSRLGRSALLDFAHREIIPRNVKSPLVHLHILHLKTCCQNWWNNWFHLPAGRCSDSHSRRHIGLSEVDLVTKDIVSPPPPIHPISMDYHVSEAMLDSCYKPQSKQRTLFSIWKTHWNWSGLHCSRNLLVTLQWKTAASDSDLRIGG